MIISLPRLENYQFYQPRYIFLIYGNTIYVFFIYLFITASNILYPVHHNSLLKTVKNICEKSLVVYILIKFRDLIVIYILIKFGADWLMFADARVYTKSNSAIFSNSRANNFECSVPIISIITLILDLLVILSPSLVLIDLYLQMLECKQSQIWQFF